MSWPKAGAVVAHLTVQFLNLEASLNTWLGFQVANGSGLVDLLNDLVFRHLGKVQSVDHVLKHAYVRMQSVVIRRVANSVGRNKFVFAVDLSSVKASHLIVTQALL